MKVTLYLSKKSREFEIGKALSAGFRHHGDDVESLPTEDYSQPKADTQVAVMIGVKGRSKQIFEDYRRAARHTLLIDKSYFGRGDYYRMILDGFQPRYAHEKPRPHDRLARLGVDILPLRKSGRHIVYAGSSQKYCDWHGLGDASEFAASICHNVNKRFHGGIPVYYRPKPSWAAGHPDDVKLIPHTIFSGPDKQLSDLLPECHALVTHGSNAGLEAIAAGVPVYLVSREGASAAWHLAEHDLQKLDDPFFPTDDQRRQAFADLAWCQFSLDEMVSGFAWETLLPHTVKGVHFDDGMTEGQRVIEMYKMMHRGAKMFRGNSMKGHTEAVADLVRKHNPTSLLDHGSGKGRQYDDLNLHERWGGLKPVCYDPGYEPLSKKPDGKFDGVISTDVAEHIPTADVPAFLKEVIGYANKFAFFCIFTEPASKFLPDGRNCHLTVKPAQWWLDQISSVMGSKTVSEFSVRKQLPGGASGEFPHHLIQVEGGPDVIVTFRGGD